MRLDDPLFFVGIGGSGMSSLAKVAKMAGYLVSGARNAAEALRRAESENPDIILIELGLKGLAGDNLGLRLKQMPSTIGTKLIVYVPTSRGLDFTLARASCDKVGISDFVESADPVLLLKECERVLARTA